jgi:very-short-patch-repair endonuclease
MGQKKGYVFTEEHKKNLSISRRKRKIDEKVGKRISEGHKRGKNNWRYVHNQLIEKFGNKFTYYEETFVNREEPMIIECPIHGEFTQTPQQHLESKHGCRKCGREALKKSRISKEEFEKRIEEEWMGRFKFNPDDYRGWSEEMKFYCEDHNEYFYKSPNELIMRKVACPVCSMSKGEYEVWRYLKKNNIKYISEFSPPDLFNEVGGIHMFDFYLPELDVIIEYDGEQHFHPLNWFGGEEAFKTQKLRDNQKDEYCKNNNIKLIRISYLDDVEESLSSI